MNRAFCASSIRAPSQLPSLTTVANERRSRVTLGTLWISVTHGRHRRMKMRERSPCTLAVRCKQKLLSGDGMRFGSPSLCSIQVCEMTLSHSFRANDLDQSYLILSGVECSTRNIKTTHSRSPFSMPSSTAILQNTHHVSFKDKSHLEKRS